MSAHVVLLRGVNVGGHNRLPMASLRGLLDELGNGPSRTYLQSGNAVVPYDGEPAALEAAVRSALSSRLGLEVAVMVRTGAQLAAAVEGNPFEVRDPKMLHVGFLSADPDPALLAGIDHERLLPDRLAFRPRVAYLDYADVSRNTPLSRLKLDVDLTARNWRTVLALHELAGS